MFNHGAFVNQLIAAGAVNGMSKVTLRGRTGGLTTSAITVWGPGAGTYAQLTAHAAMEVLSNSANDAAAGTGARTVRVDYLDATYTQASETVTLNGATPVAMAATSIIAINSITVLTAGSNLTNVGNITARTVAGSVTKAYINSNAEFLGRSADFIYTIPANHVGFLKDIHFSCTGITGDLTAYLVSKDTAGITRNEGGGRSSLYTAGFNGGAGRVHFGESGLYLPEKTLVFLQALVSAGGGAINAQAELIVVKKGAGNNPFGF